MCSAAVGLVVTPPTLDPAPRPPLPQGVYNSCSLVVGAAMAADTMKSVAYLLPDLLSSLHVLLYQGVMDILDGPRSNTAWWVGGPGGWVLVYEYTPRKLGFRTKSGLSQG